MSIEKNMPLAPAKRALAATQVIAKLAQLDGWKLHGDSADVAIEKMFSFAGYLETIAFVNAVAFIAQRQDHHPAMLVGYNTCSVRFNSHDVQGISQRDFDCAALVDALMSKPA